MNRKHIPILLASVLAGCAATSNARAQEPESAIERIAAGTLKGAFDGAFVPIRMGLGQGRRGAEAGLLLAPVGALVGAIAGAIVSIESAETRKARAAAWARAMSAQAQYNNDNAPAGDLGAAAQASPLRDCANGANDWQC